MKIARQFTVDSNRQAVWDLFQDVPAIARCMPGAELTEDRGEGEYAGRVAVKIGPFSTAFEGDARHTADPASYAGHVEGRGLDKRGGSRSKLVMDYALSEDGDATNVKVDADIQLSGPIAQFGRVGVIEETANHLIDQFVANLETQLGSSSKAEPASEQEGLEQEVDDPRRTKESSSPGDHPAQENSDRGNSINGLALFWAVLKGSIGRLFGGGRNHN